MSIVPIQSEQPEATCPNCGAALAPDQHYCLSCGKPCSPLRLPFLEVLQSAPPGPQVQGPAGYVGNGYLPPLQQSGGSGPLHRYTGLFALMGVLLLTAVIGLLIGHWAIGSSNSGNGPEVVKVEGLGGAAAAPVASTVATTTTSSTVSSSKSAEAKASAHESKQEAKETKEAKLAPAHKLNSSTVQKLSKETGKQYEQEINKVANSPAPIETP